MPALGWPLQGVGWRAGGSLVAGDGRLWNTHYVEAHETRYEPVGVPRPAWWLLIAVLTLVCAIAFSIVTATYLASPAQDCEVNSRDVLVCEDVAVAPWVFGIAASVLGVVTLGAAVMFVASGGLSTLPWFKQRAAEIADLARRLFRT
ncbi:MAG: hypothetical protein GEU28_13745 [Dehalococcoidia bacterium]|nr:hypothetical protein [Dehalococcoidia bacterium]